MKNLVKRLALLCVFSVSPAYAVDGGTLRVTTYNGWEAFEVVTQGDDVPSDGINYSMPGIFDGAGAWVVDNDTLRIQVNHETGDASISEVNINLEKIQLAINNMISTGNVGDVTFVSSLRQAYDRWTSNSGSTWTNTSSTSNTSFLRLCSGQAYAPNTFGLDRGFVDQIYIAGEEISGGRLFALDSVNRDFYQLSGTTGSAPGGIGGMPYDSWENAALVDTGETNFVAILLSPDGGSEDMKLYIGEKKKNASGNVSNSFLARNGLAYGSWYYLNSVLPSLGNTNGGSFDTSVSGALSSSKFEDIDTNPNNPTQVVLGDQNSGIFKFDFNLNFDTGFNANASSFTLTKISNESGGSGSIDSPDNLDWTKSTTLNGVSYSQGVIFVNEDNSTGEIWSLDPDGNNKIRVGRTTVGSESSGIFDLSEFVGYAPGSIIITNGQGFPSSMSLLINPDATLISGPSPMPTPTPSTSPIPLPGLTCVDGSTPLYSADFESNSDGWFAGPSSCSTGAFVAGTPSLQTSGDVTTQVSGADSGDYAWYTATNSSAGADDVDGGTCETLSPQINTDGVEAIDISLSFFHGQRDATDDASDGFSIEVLNSGSVVATLVDIGDVASDAAWTSVSSIVNNPGDIQLRVRVTDGSGAGDIVEGGIDRVLVCETESTTPPPLPTPPPSPRCSVDESFEFGSGDWTNSSNSTCSTGAYEVGTPSEQVNGGVVSQVGGASSGDNAYYTAANTSAGSQDVDGGNCVASSPTYSVDELSQLQVDYFHGQRDQGDDLYGDFFSLDMSIDGGSTFQSLVSNDDATSNAAWQSVSQQIPAGSSLVLRVQCSDGSNAGDLVECGIDNVRVCSQ